MPSTRASPPRGWRSRHVAPTNFLLARVHQEMEDARARGPGWLLADPWEFKEFSFELPMHGAQTQRAALLHLVHPETFESITSKAMKQRLLAFSGYVRTESSDIDRQLVDIRAALTEEYGHPVVFWDPGIKARWSPTSTPGPVLAAQCLGVPGQSRQSTRSTERSRISQPSNGRSDSTERMSTTVTASTSGAPAVRPAFSRSEGRWRTYRARTRRSERAFTSSPKRSKDLNRGSTSGSIMSSIRY